MEQFVLNIRFPNSGPKYGSMVVQDGTTVRDIYRYVRDTLDIKIGIFHIPQLRKLSYKDSIQGNLKNYDSLDVCLRLLAGPHRAHTEKLLIYVNIDNKSDVMTIYRDPDDRVKHICADLLEDLDKKYGHNYMWDDVELVYLNKILHPEDELALYPELSRTYISYIPSIEFPNSIFGMLLAHNDYYRMEVIGKKVDPPPKLILRLRTEDPGQKKHICAICLHDAYRTNSITLPNCRHVYCKHCMSEYVARHNTTCPQCRADI